MTSFRAATVGILLLGGASAALAQQRDPLDPIVAEALAANLGLRQERLEERRVADEVRVARGLFLPTVGIESRYSRIEGAPDLGDLVNPAYAALNQLTGSNAFPTDVALTFPQRHETRLRLTQPLFNEGIRAGYAVARGRHDAQRMQLGAAARRLAADAQASWLRHAAARRVVETLEATLLLVQENERVAQRLTDAGRGTPDAVFRARAERAEVEQQLAEAQRGRDAAVRAFNQVLRRPLDAPVTGVPDSAFLQPLTIGVEEAVARALAEREELRQADAGILTGQAAERAALSTFLPSLALAVDYGFQGRDYAFRASDDFWMVSLVAQWNVFNGFGDAARRSAARHETERARTRRTEAADLVALEVRTAHEAAAVAWAAIATADARLAAAQRTFELVRRRYEEGVAGQIEFLDARTAFTGAQLNRILTVYTYATRRVELERAAALRVLPSGF
jgi:outer membrane protein TolC